MNIKQLRLIAKDNGYQHVEAFCLMWYVCNGTTEYDGARKITIQSNPPCGTLVRIWNSRDGVTPFMTNCPSCGGDMHHVMNHPLFGDASRPNHKLHHGQLYWRDATQADYEWMYRNSSPDDKQAITQAIAEQLERRQPWLDCYLPEKEKR